MTKAKIQKKTIVLISDMLRRRRRKNLSKTAKRKTKKKKIEKKRKKMKNKIIRKILNKKVKKSRLKKLRIKIRKKSTVNVFIVLFRYSLDKCTRTYS